MSRSIPKKRKKKKPLPKPKHEDDCFRCGEGGTLVMCDLPGCTKAYHMDCLTLDKMPYGKWLCPWHHCDECGKKAVKKCNECPNSFCQVHAEGHITEMLDGKLFCEDHQELINTYVCSSASATSSEEETSSEGTVGEEPGTEVQRVEMKTSKSDSNSEKVSKLPNGELKNNHENGDISDTNIPKRGRGRPPKAVKLERRGRKPKIKLANIKTVKSANVDKANETLKKIRRQKLAAKKKVVKRQRTNRKNGKGQIATAAENNNDVKSSEQKDSPAGNTDDDEFPSLVIDLPSC